jgi:hypothetical protein
MVALQANLQGEDGVGEGANGSEGVRTLGGEGAYAWEGGRMPGEEVRTLVEGGAYAWLGGHARRGGGARTPSGEGTHAW